LTGFVIRRDQSPGIFDDLLSRVRRIERNSIPDLDGCYAFLGHHPRALYPGRMMTHVAMSAIILVLMGRI
jgi:hypothetical protein